MQQSIQHGQGMGLVAVDGQWVSSSSLQNRARNRNLILALTQWRGEAGKAAALALIRPERSQRTTYAKLEVAQVALDQRAEHNGAMPLRTHTRNTLLREGPPAPPSH
eukprot:2642929-Pyramimonas_sp.AAC.1